MKIVHKVIDFVDDKEIKLIITFDQIYIINYLEIVNFSEKEIKIKCSKGIINISGDGLMISKLLKDEVLIIGNVKAIEIG
jgi:sporulation protein YqfC